MATRLPDPPDTGDKGDKSPTGRVNFWNAVRDRHAQLLAEILLLEQARDLAALYRDVAREAVARP